MYIWDMVVGLLSFIPKLVYIISSAFLTLIDILQLLFRKLAGLDVYYVDGVAQEGDIVYHFIRGTVLGEFPILSNAFWGLLCLGFILLFLSTIVAIIRNEYATDKPEDPRKKIIGQTFKSVIFFAIVPISALFGIFLSNIILQAVDHSTSISSANSFNFLDVQKLKATTLPGGSTTNITSTYIHYNLCGIAIPTTTTTFSGAVFNASCFPANRVRLTEGDGSEQNPDRFYLFLRNGTATHFNGLFQGDNPEKVAGAIDEAFANYVKVETAESLDYSEPSISASNIASVDFFTLNTDNVAALDRYNVKLVWYYYNLWFYNFLVAFGAGLILSILFLNLAFGLMGRFIELIGLFLIAAPLIALMPLDNGEAYKAWRGKFIGKTVMVIGAIGGMNIVFIILPYLNKLSFFNFSVADSIIAVLFMIVALMAVKTFMDLISSFIKSENLNESGEKISKELGSKVAQAGMLAVGGAGLALKGAAVVGKTGARGLGAIKNIRAKNTLEGRMAQADEANQAFNLEKDDYKNKIMESDAVTKKAEKNMRSWSAYSGLSDEQFEVEKLTEAFQANLKTEKSSIADNVLASHSKYGTGMYTPKTEADFPAESMQTMAKSFAKQTLSPIPGEFVDVMKGFYGMGKQVTAPLAKSGIYEGWKEGGGNVHKAIINVNIPWISPFLSDRAKTAEFEKQVSEAYAKGNAAAEAEKRRKDKEK